jgi:predicted enzyme related to lactoylglutathione lyase
MAGEIVHFELMVKDADRAQAFWSDLFGWSFESPMAPEMDYRMARIDDKSGAAIFQAEQPKEHPNVYLSTDDIDASIAKARELGGEAEDKAPVPGFGWFAACKDTEGIAFHLWQADSAAG